MMEEAPLAKSADVPVTVLYEGSSPPILIDEKSPDKRSSSSLYCRICHEGSSLEELIEPCVCSGTLAPVHKSCLERWLSTSNTESCEICKYDFFVERRKKTICQSLRPWWRSRSVNGVRSIAGDAICLLLLSPLCLVASYMCGISAAAYSRLGFWEGTGLAVLCAVVFTTYLAWMVVTVRHHCMSLESWRRRNPVITLVVNRSEMELMTLRRKHRQERINDSNNNNESSMPSDTGHDLNRFTSWFGMYFNSPSDRFFAIQHTTIV